MSSVFNNVVDVLFGVHILGIKGQGSYKWPIWKIHEVDQHTSTCFVRLPCENFVLLAHYFSAVLL